MSNIKKFFSKIGYSDVFDKLEGEDADIDQIISDFQDEYKDVLTTEVKKTLKDSVNEDAIYKKVKNSLFQKVKTGLKLSDVGNVKEYEDEAAFIDAVKTEVQEREKSSDEKLKEKLSELTEKYNTTVSELETTTSKLTEKEQEFDTFKTSFEHNQKVKRLYDSKFPEIESLGVSEIIANDYKEQFWEYAKDNFNVDPSTGKFTDKEGQFVVMDGRKVDDLASWIQIKVDEKGLPKQNNGKKAGAFSSGSSSTDDPELNKWAEDARASGVSESTIKTYLQNRKPVEKS